MDHPVVVVTEPGRTPLHLSVRAPVVIGRECDGLLVTDDQVSRRHVQLHVDARGVVVTDLGSTNGTFLDGERLTSPVILPPGSRVRLGSAVTVELVHDPARLHRTPDTVAGSRRTSIDVVVEAVASERPVLPPADDDQGTITIVFSDIESSTERALALGDVTWMEVLAVHNEIVQRQATRHGGTVVKNQGDGFMLTFPGARRALRAVIAMQEELTRWEARHPDRAVRVRFGLHTGEVIADAGDIYGKHVIVAARVANLAEGGEILVSDLVKQIASARGDLVFGPPRDVELKGIEGVHTVHPVRWAAETDQSAPGERRASHPRG